MTCEYWDIANIEKHLAEMATSVNTGEMVKIISKTPIGIEWLSSLEGQWFMQTESAKGLIKGWDGQSSVYWYWDATFKDGTEARAFVFCPPELLREISDYYGS